MSELEQLPPSESHRLVKIKGYELRPGIVNGTWILVVHGTAPCANMNVTLEPAVYIRQPQWWRVEAVGTLPGGICLTSIREYTATLPVAQATGTQGIELVGKGYSERIPIHQGAPDEVEPVIQVSSVATAVLESQPPQLRVTAKGTASTPGWGNPRLQLRPLTNGVPDDGFVDLDFVAERPEGIVPQVLAPISGTLRWEEYGKYADKVRGVRVHAKTNSLEHPLPTEPLPGPSYQEQVDLPLDEALTVDNALCLRLTDVDDSRCPANAICVWAGFVTVTIEATLDGAAHELKLSSEDEQPAAVGDYRIALVNVRPYPMAGVPQPQPPIATVMVMRT